MQSDQAVSLSNPTQILVPTCVHTCKCFISHKLLPESSHLENPHLTITLLEGLSQLYASIWMAGLLLTGASEQLFTALELAYLSFHN